MVDTWTLTSQSYYMLTLTAVESTTYKNMRSFIAGTYSIVCYHNEQNDNIILLMLMLSDLTWCHDWSSLAARLYTPSSPVWGLQCCSH